ncbi:MAG: PPOX class F420-dependent oxidoreductase [Thermomicrobiales bacterium]
MGLIPEDKVDLVTKPVLAHVATIGSDGAPQNNPVWFDWDGEFLRFSQTTERQKYRNLKNNGGVSLSIVDPENAYRYLEIRGKLERIDPDPEFAFIHSMAKKYMGVDQYPWLNPAEERVVMVIRPVKTTQMG